MPSLFTSVLIVHISGGTTGLISGTIAASAKKGGKLHKASGVVFFWGMLTASLVAFVLSNLPGHHSIFLFAVGGFTLYMICSGYRIVYLKRSAKHNEKPFGPVDYGILLFGFCFGIFLIYMGITTVISGVSFGIVPAVFGMICMNFARHDYRMLFKALPVKSIWMHSHIVRMMGAMIASYTAFLVVNVRFEPNWILWLAPTLAGTALIVFFLRKYTPDTKKMNG
jgi:uncharacterized membrane protein